MNTVHYDLNQATLELPPKNTPFALSIDSRLITTLQVKLPTMSLSKAKKAIPYELEDSLLDNITDLEFFIFKTTDKNLWDVIVIKKQIISTIQEQLAQQISNIKYTTFDFMLIPLKEKVITYIKKNNYIIYRKAAYQGGCLEEKLFFDLYKDSEIDLTNIIEKKPKNNKFIC